MLGIDGRYPALDFLEENERKYEKDVAEVQRYMERMAKAGQVRNKTKFKALENGLFEFKSGTNGLRVTCFWHKGKLLICGHCFIKKSQKTPKRHLKKALGIKKNFEDTLKTEGIHHE